MFATAAIALAFVNPLDTSQRVTVLSVVAFALLWLAALILGLRRTREGLDRLGGLPPLALELLPPLVMVTIAIVIDRMGTGRTGAAWFAGIAAGAVLSFPFSLTQRWLWWEWRWRRRRRISRTSPRPRTSHGDHQDDRRSGVAEPDGPTVG